MPIASSPFVAHSCERFEGHTIRSVHDPGAGAVALFCEHCGLAEPLSKAIYRSIDHSSPTTDAAEKPEGEHVPLGVVPAPDDSDVDEIPF